MDDKSGVMHIQGTATVADVLNYKKQVYPLEVWQDNVPRLERLLQQGKLVGEADHPPDGKSTLAKTSIKWTKLWLDDKELKFEAAVLPTIPDGKNLQILLSNGVSLDVSSRGRGVTKKQEWNGVQDVDVVQRGFLCQTFDAVLNGASPGAAVENYRFAQSDAAEEEFEMSEISEKILKQLEAMAAQNEANEKKTESQSTALLSVMDRLVQQLRSRWKSRQEQGWRGHGGSGQGRRQEPEPEHRQPEHRQPAEPERRR